MKPIFPAKENTNVLGHKDKFTSLWFISFNSKFSSKSFMFAADRKTPLANPLLNRWYVQFSSNDQDWRLLSREVFFDNFKIKAEKSLRPSEHSPGETIKHLGRGFLSASFSYYSTLCLVSSEFMWLIKTREMKEGWYFFLNTQQNNSD